MLQNKEYVYITRSVRKNLGSEGMLADAHSGYMYNWYLYTHLQYAQSCMSVSGINAYVHVRRA